MPLRRYWLPLLIVLLLGTACAEPKLIVADLPVDNALAMEATLRLRISPVAVRTHVNDPHGLWNELPVPAKNVAILGFVSEPSPWRVSATLLAGDPPGRSDPPLDELTLRRLARFLNHTREDAAVTGADPVVRRRVLATHTARALATEIIARDRAPVLFVQMDARAPGLNVYCADAVRDLLALAGPRGGGLIFLRDERQNRLLVVGDLPLTVPERLTRAGTVELMRRVLDR